VTATVSVIIPVYNEEAGLDGLFARLYPALDQLGRPGDAAYWFGRDDHISWLSGPVISSGFLVRYGLDADRHTTTSTRRKPASSAGRKNLFRNLLPDTQKWCNR